MPDIQAFLIPFPNEFFFQISTKDSTQKGLQNLLLRIRGTHLVTENQPEKNGHFFRESGCQMYKLFPCLSRMRKILIFLLEIVL
jgi:hypothetical protein